MKDWKKTEATNIRLTPELKSRVETIAKINQISISDLFRLALLRELPDMEAGRFVLNPGSNLIQQAGRT